MHLISFIKICQISVWGFLDSVDLFICRKPFQTREYIGEPKCSTNYCTDSSPKDWHAQTHLWLLAWNSSVWDLQSWRILVWRGCLLVLAFVFQVLLLLACCLSLLWAAVAFPENHAWLNFNLISTKESSPGYSAASLWFRACMCPQDLLISIYPHFPPCCLQLTDDFCSESCSPLQTCLFACFPVFYICRW